jgi:hypothetical protein
MLLLLLLLLGMLGMPHATPSHARLDVSHLLLQLQMRNARLAHWTLLPLPLLCLLRLACSHLLRWPFKPRRCCRPC